MGSTTASGRSSDGPTARTGTAWMIAAQKCRKFHPQQRALLGLMLGRMPGRDRYQQGTPCFKGPRQTRHDHVRPVADQVSPPASSGAPRP